MKHFVCFLMGLVVVFTVVSEVTAVPVTITNAGFEFQALADGAFTNSITGWTSFPDGGPVGQVGVFNPTSAHFPGEAPEGSNTAFSNGSGFYQFLSDSLTPGTYTLQVEVGNRLETNFPGYGVRLQANTIILAQDLSMLSPSNGSFETSVVTFTADVSNPNLGQPLVIALTNPGGVQVNFDNVRLDFAATAQVPEPSTLILLGVGALGFIHYGWRRRKQDRKEKM